MLVNWSRLVFAPGRWGQTLGSESTSVSARTPSVLSAIPVSLFLTLGWSALAGPVYAQEAGATQQVPAAPRSELMTLQEAPSPGTLSSSRNEPEKSGKLDAGRLDRVAWQSHYRRF